MALAKESIVSTASPCVLDSLCFLKDLVSILPIALTFGDLINVMRLVITSQLIYSTSTKIS